MKTPALALILFALACQHTIATDWNQWRGPNRDGLVPGGPKLTSKLPSSGLKPLWVSEQEIPSARAGGWSSPIVADGKVYIYTHQRVRVGEEEMPERKFPWLPPEKRVGMSSQEYQDYEVNRRDEDEAFGRFYQYADVVYCMDATSGKKLWTTQEKAVYTRFPQSGSPAVIDGKVYVLGAAYVARCLDAKTGDQIWKTRLPGDFRDQYMQSSFAIAEGVAVVLCGPLFGLNTNDGEILWQHGEEAATQLHTSPVIWEAGDRQLVICNVPGQETVCVDPQNGDELWRVESLASHSTPLVVGDQMLTYGSSRKGGLRCFELSRDGAKHLWTFHGANDSGSSPVVVGDYAFVQGERMIACVNLATGEEMWMGDLEIGNPRYTSLVAADNKLIYAFDGFVCVEANGKEFKVLADGKIDKDGLLADKSDFRKMMKLDELETSPEGRKESDRLWRKRFDGAGPLTCTTPAIVDGLVYLRTPKGVACYDLRQR